MDKIAVIGGSYLSVLKNLVVTHSTSVKTPFGEPSAPLTYGILGEQEVVYLPRRGGEKLISPHQINYRANIWALRDAGVQTVLATAAVAGISEDFPVGTIVVPDQLIDYTHNRESTFLGEDSRVTHIFFSEPYTEGLRRRILAHAAHLRYNVKSSGTYAVTQGPRFETRAEVQRLQRDGSHIVGMTGMPEAALARELGLDYAVLALVIRNVHDVAPLDEQERIEKAAQCVEHVLEAMIVQASVITTLPLFS